MNFKIDANCSYIEKQIKSLEKLTDEDRPFTRLVFSKKFYEARSWLSEQFNLLGLSISTDEAGNLIGLLKANGITNIKRCVDNIKYGVASCFHKSLLS